MTSGTSSRGSDGRPARSLFWSSSRRFCSRSNSCCCSAHVAGRVSPSSGILSRRCHSSRRGSYCQWYQWYPRPRVRHAPPGPQAVTSLQTAEARRSMRTARARGEEPDSRRADCQKCEPRFCHRVTSSGFSAACSSRQSRQRSDPAIESGASSGLPHAKHRAGSRGLSAFVRSDRDATSIT